MIEFRIQEKTRSLNTSLRGGWLPRYRATKRERTKAMQACPKWPGGPLLVVRLTRVSPGVLDQANLAGALKHVQDGVASRLKVDDASPLVQWLFEQAVGEAEVVVQIWKDGEDSPPLPVGRLLARRRVQALATVTADAGKRLAVVRDPGKGQKRAPRPAYEPPVPRGSRTNPIATKALEPSNAAEHRALLAAQEAEATFAFAYCGCAGRHSEECIQRGVP